MSVPYLSESLPPRRPYLSKRSRASCIILSALLCVAVGGLALFGRINASQGLPQYIQEFDVPTSNAAPLAITVDSHGFVWFTESNTAKLAKFDPAERAFTEYSVPTPGDMWGVAVDRNGKVWFTQYSGRGSVNPGGAIVPGGEGRLVLFDPAKENFTVIGIPGAGSFPMRLTVDEQNRIWFTEFLGNKIGFYDQASGQLLEYQIPTNSSGPADLAFDSQGKLWFSEAYAQSVAQFSPESKTFVEYQLGSRIFSPVGIAPDQKGHVWVADHGGNWIGEFDPATDKLSRYPTHFPPKDVYPLSIPNGLLVDGMGKIWFTEHGGNSIGYIDPTRINMLEYRIPSGPVSTALWLASAPNGDIWFTEWSANKIGVVRASQPIPLSLSASKNTLQLGVGEQTLESLAFVTSQEIVGNGTFRYALTSYNPDELSVIFSPQYPSLSGPSTMSVQAEILPSATMRAGNYTVSFGIDAGSILIWTIVQAHVVAPSQVGDSLLENPILFAVSGIVLVVILGGFLFRELSRRGLREIKKPLKQIPKESSLKTKQPH